MKIILIAPGDGGFTWPRRCDAAAFDAACREAAERVPLPLGSAPAPAEGYRIFTADSPAAVQTARTLFSGPEAFTASPLLRDIRFRSFREDRRSRPLWLWRAMARLQWRLGKPRQPESRRSTAARAREVIALAETGGESCVLVTPRRFLTFLAGELERAGYVVEGRGPFGGVRPLDRIRATKKNTHCGGCIHNCPLANPGCGIGLTKAKDLGVTPRR